MRLPVDSVEPKNITQGWNPPVHYGLDIAKSTGVSIKSPVTGTVIAVGTDPNYIGGLFVIVREDDPEGLEYYTGHHSSVTVSNGQKVKEGQEIAKMGKTGSATGPHTHFQIRRKLGGELLNPNEVIARKGGQPDMQPITPNELDDLIGMMQGRKATEEDHKNWDGKPFYETYMAWYKDGRTFQYADKVYKAINNTDGAANPKAEALLKAVQDAVK